jgi:hypothetical protein
MNSNVRKPAGGRRLSTAGIVAAVLCLATGAPDAAAESSFQITYTPDVPANARAAFDAAAAAWSSRLQDPVTVKITVGWEPLGSTTLGQATTWVAYGEYDVLRDILIDGGDPGDARESALLPALPTYGQLSLDLPPGFGHEGTAYISTANYKALGGPYTGEDGSIDFSSTFPWDFDPSNGITLGAFDFQGVAAHEMGHILGFLSGLDTVDYAMELGQTVSDVWISALDLFRFDTADLLDPGFDFTTSPRDLTPGGSHSFYYGDGSILMSTGESFGDGYQGSHWKDDLGLGIMDPTASPGERLQIGANDLIVLDLIGWDVVPEPSTLVLALAGLLAGACAAWRRRQPGLSTRGSQ